jgi:hypothetical protein
MLKEADMLEWLARRLHAGLPLPTEAAPVELEKARTRTV